MTQALAAAESTRQGPDSTPPSENSPPYNEREFFGPQHTPAAKLPPPEPLLENLTRCVIEVLAGARELEQLTRWVSDEVFRHLLIRVVLASRARAAKNQPPRRPQFAIGRISMYQPHEDVIEAVVMVHQRTRSRAVALRLEGLDSRWRATAINVL